MANNEFTNEQKLAIESVGKNVLVSASAGSGKTTIMMERVSRMVTDTLDLHKPIQIDRMMVVTFTKAVAKELKNKISKVLLEAIKNTNGEKAEGLRKQIESLPLANISTLHSLCSSMIREHFDILNIDPAFQIMEDNESDLLLNTAINNVIDKHKIDFTEEFAILTSFFSYDMVEVLKKLYNFIRIQPKFDNYLAEKAINTYTNEIKDSQLVIDLLDYWKKKIKKYLVQIDKYIDIFEPYNDTKAVINVLEVLSYYKLYLSKFLNAEDLIGYYTVWQQYVDDKVNNWSSAKLVKISDEIDNYKNQAKDFKNKVKSFIDKKLGIILMVPYETIKKIQESDLKDVQELISLEKEIDVEYSRIKSNENKLDFNDLEHKMVELLSVEKNAIELRERFDFVFVDEYQDINPLQEQILKTISNGSNLFMVGDVKQCIYGFRQSDPNIFLTKYDNYKNAVQDGVAVDLKKNFRSREQVLSFVNEIFNVIMKRDFGGVDYKNDAQLVYGVGDKYRKIDYNPIKVAMCVKDKNEKTLEIPEDKVYSVKEHFKNIKNKDGELEGKYIAKKIQELVNNEKYLIKDDKIIRPIKYSDIVILCGARNSRVLTIVNTISDCGFPIDSTNIIEESKNNEIQLLIALLSIIDNPNQDIPLCVVLMSPFGGFTLSELAEIRSSNINSKENYYKIFMNYNGENKDFKNKISLFNKLIEKYRFEAKFMSVDKLLERIIAENLYDEYVLSKENGVRSLAQLRTFISNLIGKSYNVSISKFLSVYRDFDSLDETKAAKPIGDNCIRTATIHASKGLEYPVVFLVDCGRLFPTCDGKSKYFADKDYGISIKHIDRENRTYCTTVVNQLMINNIKKRDIEEAKRLLYVALTRAKEFLFLTGSGNEKNTFSNYGDTSIESEDARSFFDWINIACSKVEGFKEKYCEMITETDMDIKDSNATVVYANPSDSKYSDLNNVMIKDYKYLASTTNGIYHSVTEINSKVREEDIDLQDYMDQDEFEEDFKHESPNSAKVGTAYHRVLELIDYNCFSIADVDNQMHKMVENNQLTQEQRDSVNSNDILKCLESDIIKKAKLSIPQREKKFKLYLPANEVLDTDITDKIIIQGTLDLFIPKSANNKENILVDFKYSNSSVEEIKKTYQKQLDIYAMALEVGLGEKVDKKIIYVLGANKVIEY